MPTYEYSCEKCGLRFEKLQEMSAEPVKECPECGGYTRRLIGRAGLIFKGSGFYTTDYNNVSPGATCCGRDERCEKPPCSDDGACKR
ncbi:FmdB family zinc ribbon protein [Candidatus Neomarinimicrobiota bacterium]